MHKLVNGVKVDLTEQEIAEIQAEWAHNEAQKPATLEALKEQQRLDAYRNEADPLFFKWQRGEATEQEWLNKIQEIKGRY